MKQVAGATDQPTEQAPDAQERREQAQRLLLAWYAAYGRAHLPWRATRDPYAVLVSEIMLQQTQVERVLPKYTAFLRRFPTLRALAGAPTGDVIKEWAGLGYNMRAVRLQTIARQAVETNDGRLPATLDGLLALKGIGRYTAGAVACFAFGLPVATVDTNIRRVLWRVFRGIEPATWPTGEVAVRAQLALAEQALPSEPSTAAYDWQQALMDLGATICISRKPLCEQCPLASVCAAWAEVSAVTLFPSGEALARLRDERAAAPTAHDDADTPTLARVAERRADNTTDAMAGDQSQPPKATRAAKAKKVAKTQPFTSTTRYFRGRIVDALRALPAGEHVSLAALGPLIKPDFTAGDLPWLRGLAQGLARDGLARLETTADDEALALP